MEETKEKTITNKKIDKEYLSKFKNVITQLKFYKKPLIIVLILILIVVVWRLLLPKQPQLTTIAESSLKEVIETSNLSTVEYIYNSIVTVSDEENNPKYHVAYEGTVKAGFDFNKISILKDEKNKKISIVIPEIQINSVSINDKSFDFIFEKDKYDTETTFQEAYNICYSDLENKSISNKAIMQMAYDNAVESMKAILIPLEKELPEEYVFDFIKESELK